MIVERPYLSVVYQDDQLVIIDKPSGLLVHRTALARKEKLFAMQLLRDQLGCHVFPVHRLDRPTSGLLVFALNADMAREMSELIQQQGLHKEYVALARGWIQQSGKLDYPLKEELDKTTDSKAQTDKAPQPAVTHYRPLQYLELPYAAGRYAASRLTWVHLKPETGRKHQLRRHLAHLRHPIIGDTTHGDGRQNRAFANYSQVQRLMLHACALKFEHPCSGSIIQVKAPLPVEWQHMQADHCWAGNLCLEQSTLIESQ